jgi:hypothetical protein
MSYSANPNPVSALDPPLARWEEDGSLEQTARLAKEARNREVRRRNAEWGLQSYPGPAIDLEEFVAEHAEALRSGAGSPVSLSEEAMDDLGEIACDMLDEEYPRAWRGLRRLDVSVLRLRGRDLRAGPHERDHVDGLAPGAAGRGGGRRSVGAARRAPRRAGRGGGGTRQEARLHPRRGGQAGRVARGVSARLRTFPPADVRLALIEAKRMGLDFEAAWEATVRPTTGNNGNGAVTTRTAKAKRPPLAVAWPGDTQIRREWREAIDTTKEGWRRAYCGEPCRGDNARTTSATRCWRSPGMHGDSWSSP